MQTPLNIRDANLGDVTRLARLHGELFQPGWDADSFVALMQGANAIALLAEAGAPASDAGFIVCRVVVDEAEILTIGVAQSWQRHGIAARLMAEALERATQGGATRMFLEVAADNGPAQSLYAGLGFVEVGRRSRYYDRPGKDGADAVIMAKVLAP